MKKIIHKKAQEEMVGFVLIVVIVAVIAVIFLGITLRQPSNKIGQESERLSSFLSAVSEFTTACEIPETNFKTIGQLVSQCSKGGICSNERSACDVLESDLKPIMASAYVVGKGSFAYSYNLSITSGEGATKRDIITPITAGSIVICPGTKLYSDFPYISSGSEQLSMRLEVCFNKEGYDSN